MRESQNEEARACDQELGKRLEGAEFRGRFPLESPAERGMVGGGVQGP